MALKLALAFTLLAGCSCVFPNQCPRETFDQCLERKLRAARPHDDFMAVVLDAAERCPR